MTASAFSQVTRFEQFVRRDPARRGLIRGDAEGPGSGELLASAASFQKPVTGVCLVTGFFIPDRQAIRADSLSAAPLDHSSVVPESQTAGSSRSPGTPFFSTATTGTTVRRREGPGASGPEASMGASAPAASGSLATPGSAETDGPPGTALLACVLHELGIPVTVVTDPLCDRVVRRAVASVGLEDRVVVTCPADPAHSDKWRADFLQTARQKRTTSHVIAIERVGPGHTVESLIATDPQAGILQSRPLEELKSQLPGQCMNMRGESIEEFSFALHRLFEGVTAELPEVTTIGIGDGGNEIGMGRYSWSELRRRISGARADSIPCRIATEHTIVAGISNWGAYALAASIALLRGRVDVLQRHTEDSQRELLEAIVHEAEAVDGVTRRREATVDGVPFLTGIQPWSAIRRELGLP